MLAFSPVNYLLDHTAVVTVAGAQGREASLAKTSGIDIAPGTSVIALKLNNARNIPITLSLDAPVLIAGGGTIACAVTQNGAKEALVTINGAVLNDELSLTLRIGADGRDFDPYTFSVRCPAYTVTFDIQGFGTPPPLQTVTLFSSITEPSAPLPSGLPDFLGWFKDALCTTPWDFAADTVIGQITLYAGWNAARHTVTFDMQGHGTQQAEAEVYDGGLVTEPSAPSATGWTFGGWFKEAACTNAWNFASDTVSANTTLYAKWRPKGYTGGDGMAGNPWQITVDGTSTNATWTDAVNAIKNGGNDQSYTLNISGNLSVPGTAAGATFSSVTGLNVTLGGTGSLTLSGTGRLIGIGADQTVTIGDGTNGPDLSGNSGNTASLVTVSGTNANLVLQNGTLTGNTTGYNGGGVVVSVGAAFTMSGGAISGNTASSTGASYGYGGGVYVSGGTFIMSGGTISGNTARPLSDGTYGGTGGGVYLSGGTFTMSGGTITGNTAISGGGVFAYSGALTLTSPAALHNTTNGIYGNTATANAYAGNQV
jgi:uncharacterized repeat protein (TIGR02543 family)